MFGFVVCLLSWRVVLYLDTLFGFCLCVYCGMLVALSICCCGVLFVVGCVCYFLIYRLFLVCLLTLVVWPVGGVCGVGCLLMVGVVWAGLMLLCLYLVGTSVRCVWLCFISLISWVWRFELFVCCWCFVVVAFGVVLCCWIWWCCSWCCLFLYRFGCMMSTWVGALVYWLG